MDIRSQNTPAAPAAPTTPPPASPPPGTLEPGFEVRPNDIPTDQLNTVYRGSMQEVLSQNTGLFVMIEFLVGTQTLVRKQGILYSVGISFLVLYDTAEETYVVCDLYSVKFVTFYDERGENASGTQSDS